jgi:opacity protein-like surface antigen
MKKKIAVGLATALLVASPAMAADVESETSKPVTLTEQQMDSITAAGPMAYGKTIMIATGVSFGQLIGPAKKAGTAVHSNYAGGAKALVENVCVHIGC